MNLFFLLSFLQSNKENLPDIYEIQNGMESDTIERSFIEKTLLIYQQGVLSVKGKKLSGNIVL